MTDYANNFNNNMSHTHGYVGGTVDVIANDLLDGSMSARDAAVRLLALKRCMDEAFVARGESGSAKLVFDNYYSTRLQVQKELFPPKK
jgi:hypothetical protein